ncbi:hypothetical protein [Cohnella sp. AR92]|uniref:hypothetical protein n=1 Tax=Cohnella sp. AR92 TaxID=648716 RepID=UPI000F8EB10C|nr:hypothetical protein [Cohnella sp. AR92]RUS45183.1 hypothetical protein ELR57_19895 [Cohnella sp. AR92]
MEEKQAGGELSAEPKKISLAEAMKRKLEQKKQAQYGAKGSTDHYSTATKKMTSQIKKKPNNQKKRTGV